MVMVQANRLESLYVFLHLLYFVFSRCTIADDMSIIQWHNFTNCLAVGFDADVLNDQKS